MVEIAIAVHTFHPGAPYRTEANETASSPMDCLALGTANLLETHCDLESQLLGS